MVQLEGKKSVVGIEPFFSGGKNQGSFFDLLCQYRRADNHIESDQDEAILDERLEQARRSISRSDLSVEVVQANDDKYDLQVKLPDDPISLPEGVHISCHPISLDELHAQIISGIEGITEISFKNLSIVSLTGFIAFKVTAKLGNKTSSISFVLNLPVTGLPEDRNSFVITNVINNSRNFIRYLLLILSSDPNTVINSFIEDSEGKDSDRGTDYMFQAVDDIPLFEELLRASSRNPEKIKQIASLINEIKKTNPNQNLFPEGFDDIWTAITTGL